jgi:cytidylate kinase
MNKKIIIAIDGLSSTGKSTLAKFLAKKLNYTYIDSGAMYRGITLYFLENNISLENENEILATLKNIKIHFEKNALFLNNKNIEADIRNLHVASHVSQVAAIPAVRDFCVAQQQLFGKNKSVVMDGRDIGTVVFPEAELKIFLTASTEIRNQRRFDELKIKDEKITLSEVGDNLAKRDFIDTTRAYNPLRKASDARELDNTFLNIEQQISIIEKWIEEIN